MPGVSQGALQCFAGARCVPEVFPCSTLLKHQSIPYMQVEGCGKPVDGADRSDGRKFCSDCRTAAFVSVMIRSTGEMEPRKWCSLMHTSLPLPGFQGDDGGQRR